MVLLGIVSSIAHAVTGKDHPSHTSYTTHCASAYVPACTCNQQHCSICAYVPPLGCRRQRRRCGRANRHAQKAYLWSGGHYPATTGYYHPAQYEGVTYQPRQREMDVPVVSSRRYSLDMEKTMQPPAYEEGAWVERRRSIDVLNDGKDWKDSKDSKET